jgi:hypothetical protein
MKTILRYPLQGRHTIVSMPRGAKIIHVGPRPADKVVNIWVLCESGPKNPSQERAFTIVGTGWALPNDPGVHIGSYFQDEYVWHVFETTEQMYADG